MSMNNNYNREVANLAQTYAWGLSAPIDSLIDFAHETSLSPLYAVGSGGSLTSASIASLLHESFFGVMSKALTPLQLVSLGKLNSISNVLILSASGKNADINAAFHFAVSAGARQILSICMRTDSALGNLTKRYRHAQIIDFNLPTGKDGFLATNSLLATATLLIRAYTEASTNSKPILPEKLFSSQAIYAELTENIQQLLPKRTWIVLYGGWGLPAAVDIESKFNEVALKNVQLTDYRNFGHGRHHWIAKRGLETGIVALITPGEKALAQKTLSFIPSSIPVLPIVTDQNGPTGGLDLLVKILHLVDILGDAQGIDPGKPGVPEFGRRLYHLRLPLSNFKSRPSNKIARLEEAAILKKCKRDSLEEMDSEELKFWNQAYHRFVKRLQATSFGAIVFDFDGTLCDPFDRFSGLADDVGYELVRLLETGIYLGIATGRGKSVRIALKQYIPKKFWDKVLIGYYNGAEIAPLDDENAPDKQALLHPSLEALLSILKKYNHLIPNVSMDIRPNQISLQPLQRRHWNIVRASIIDAVKEADLLDVQVMESSHSIDLVAPGISKRSLVTTIQAYLEMQQRAINILCFGDKGEWPGNDYELLYTPYSISVDTVTAHPERCWNLSLPEHRGVQALLIHLRNIDVFDTKQVVRIKVR